MQIMIEIEINNTEMDILISRANWNVNHIDLNKGTTEIWHLYLQYLKTSGGHIGHTLIFRFEVSLL